MLTAHAHDPRQEMATAVVSLMNIDATVVAHSTAIEGTIRVSHTPEQPDYQRFSRIETGKSQVVGAIGLAVSLIQKNNLALTA